jgi:hypothetical protein
VNKFFDEGIRMQLEGGVDANPLTDADIKETLQ